MTTFTAFAGELRIGSGDMQEVRAAIAAMEQGTDGPSILVFDDVTGKQVDIDPRDIAPQEEPRGRGRPRLGVQPREVTLLPRHWDWLATQPGGASVTLRKLVEAARKGDAGPASPRAAMDAAYHFLTAMAGDRPGYEEALRALYAGDKAGFDRAAAKWPGAIRNHGAALAAPAFG